MSRLTHPARGRRTRGFAAALVAPVMVALLAVVPAQADHAEPEPGPIHAGTTYGWWNKGVVWREEFEAPYSGPTGPQWQGAGAGEVVHQNGMLTLNATGQGDLTATLAGAGAEVGRWETRLRSRQYGRAGARYKVLAELVPAAGTAENCGARNIALASYAPGSKVVDVYARTLPNVAYKARNPGMDLRRDRWHTYAVEVTRERISWFIDAHVVYTEARGDLLSGTPLTVRFTLKAKPGKAMKVSRMQMDWVRHWSLAAPNTLPVDAPSTRAGVYGQAC